MRAVIIGNSAAALAAAEAFRRCDRASELTLVAAEPGRPTPACSFPITCAAPLPANGCSSATGRYYDRPGGRRRGSAAP